jgi:(2Fe-2S) ferredoxin
VYQTFLEEFERRTTVPYQLTSTGCLGPCALGANVLVYPEGILYGRVTPRDVQEIIEQHLLSGKPVTRLVVEDLAD